MAEDWSLDVKKYVPDADDAIIAGLVRHCGIALRSRDASLVAFSDAKETDRVKTGFLRKKLGLDDPESVLDAAIAAVGERMKADRTKNRVTVYYLLASHFGRLEDFRPKSKAAAAAELPLAAAAAQLPLAAAAAQLPLAAAAAMPLRAVSVRPAGPAAARPGVILFWLLGLVAIGFAAAMAMIISGADNAAAPAVPAALAAAPAPAPDAVPNGAGLTTEDRGGMPVLIVYFDVGKAEVAAGFAEKAAGVQAFAASRAGSKYVVSGFNDPTGNAALNAELSKQRARAVQAALVASGAAAADIVLEKPPETTDAQVSPAQARRVEVIIR